MRMLREAGPRFGPETRAAHLEEWLRSTNLESFEGAQRLLGEISEGTFAEGLENALRESHCEQPWPPSRRQTSARYAVFRYLEPPLTGLGGLGLLVIWTQSCRSQVLAFFVLLAFIGYFFWVLLLRRRVVRFVTRPGQPKPSDVDEPAQTADNQDARIERKNNQVFAFEPNVLRIRFCKESLNVAVARDDITPIWDFGHDDLAPEHGWEVIHYFPGEGPFWVRVTFQRRDGGFVSKKRNEPTGTDGAIVQMTKEIAAQPPRREGESQAVFLEFARLVLALLPVLGPLYVAASEKLTTANLTVALGAIFALGFASEQVKNLMVQQPE